MFPLGDTDSTDILIPQVDSLVREKWGMDRTYVLIISTYLI